MMAAGPPIRMVRVRRVSAIALLVSVLSLMEGSNGQEFEASLYNFTINQNGRQNDVIYAVNCIHTGEIRYNISSFDSTGIRSLSIDPQNGMLSLTLDAIEVPVGMYQMTLQCYDPSSEQGSTDFSFLYLVRVDENEFKPIFQHSSTIDLSISEAQEPRPEYIVLDLNATDEDVGSFGNIEYGTQGPLPAPFSLDQSTGIITLVSSLDYDRSENHYIIIVTASNPPIPATGVVRSAEALVSISVLDVNDELPTFSEPDGYQVSAHETAPDHGYPRPSPGFFSVECTDLDNPPSNITYAISSEGDPGPFTLDTQTGDLTVTQDFDYETRTSYSFEVSCYDNGQFVNLSSSVFVDVTILSVNEFEPTINSSGLKTIAIPETIMVGTILFSSSEGVGEFGTYILEDLDAGPDGQLVYFIGVDEGDNQYFEVDVDSGDLKIILPLDIDVLSSAFLALNVRIRACDTTPPRPTCPNLLKQVIVLPVNEFTPHFEQEDFDVSFSELTGIGTTIAVATCQDADVTYGTSYYIMWHDPSAEVLSTFRVDSRTGVLTTTQTLDYESYESYTVILVCTDFQLEDSTVVKITVEPENDNLPQFESPTYTFGVSRTTPDNRYQVGRVVAIDDDIDKGGELNYTLVDRSNHFAVTSDGVIELFNTVMNYTGDNISLMIEVSDGQNTDVTQVLIQLTPGNLHQPEISLTNFFFQVSELSSPGTQIATVVCTDQDAGVNGEITLTIVAGNTDSVFELDSTSGQLTVAKSLVLPQDSADVRYDLAVHCQDGGIPVFSDDVTIFVSVFQDSTPPEIQNETIVAFVSEDAGVNTEVTTIVSSNLEMNEIEFGFHSESVPNIFEIGSSSGVVIVAAALDREMVSQYQMVVVATEVRQPGQIGPIRSDNATLIIYVRDVNDNKPNCQPIDSVMIEETASPGALILKLNCSDLDFGSNADINYTLADDFNIFAVNSLGEITLMNSLNQTELNTFILSVMVADNGMPQLQDSYQVTIFVLHTNRHIPTFVNLPATIRVGEAQPIQEVIFMAEATDPDRGSFGYVSYGIVDEDSLSGPFHIFENTGGVILTQKLDYFEQQRYLVNISASDSDNTVVETLTVQVLDENEYPPQCDMTVITATILEGLPPQTLTSRLLCSDNDRGPNGNLMFTIESAIGRNTFMINSDGSIVTLQALDFEIVDRYELQVNVSDLGDPPLSVSATVAIIVQPVNEFSPMFQQEVYTTTLQESTEVGTSVLDIFATDQDSPTHPHGQVSYSVLGTEAQHFSISNTGVLQVAGNIDRELQSFYSLQVQASDQGQPARVDTTTVEITILDLDDSPPEFTQPVYVGTLNGTTARGTPVLTVTCADKDLGINAEVTYALTGSEGSGFVYFEVLSSGLIQVTEDLPISQTYTFRATCTGRGPSNFSDHTIITIRVLVESNITFIPPSYTATVSEATEAGYTILYVNASSSTHVQLTYNLLSIGTPFTVDSSTGELQLLAALDYETTTSYVLQVQASDNGNPPSIGEALVQITVQNENDHSPVISTNPETLAVPEGPMVVPRTIGSYHCTDGDAGSYGQVEFTIASGNLDSAFSISQSGILQLISELDYETTQFYSLELQCMDGGVPHRHDSITVPVSVLPINDNAPDFASDTLEISVTENLLLSSDVGTAIQATDTDLAPHNSLRYSITSGNSDPRAFAIASTTGQLTLIQTLDYETKQTFSLVILVEDSGGQVSPDFTVLNDTITVEITVVDYNDIHPVLSQTLYTGSIEERASIGDQVLLDKPVLCTDLDSGSNGMISLHIVEESPFDIQSSGIVTVKEALDFETERNYQLTVQCRDGGTPQLNVEGTVVISILDSNEFGPEFNQSLYSIQVRESAVPGTTVGGIFAEDRDAGEAGDIRYTLTNATTNAFALDPSTGMITLLSSLDYETQPRFYVFEAAANDTAGLDAVTTVIIQVLNDDDNKPSFTLGNYLASVPENTDTGTLVVQVSCVDADDQADNVPVSYQLESNGVPFDIIGGSITVTGEIDLEFTPRYTLDVMCSDSAGNSASATVTVNVDPFNDFAPVFTLTPYLTDLAENTGIGQSVFQVTATDDDTVMYNDITFSFVSGNEEGRFEIHPSSGVVTVTKSIDREEEDSYELVVQALNAISPTDISGSQPLSATTMLTISINDVNDNDPIITPSSLSRFIPEDESAGITIETFSCSDEDLGLNALTNFSITSGNTGVFELSEDGVLSTVDTITSNVALQVACSDNGTPQRVSTAVVVIETMSMNDYQPMFSDPTSSVVTVLDDTPVGTDIICFNATDEDGTDTPDGIVSYSLEVEFTGSDISRFGIRENTGCVFISIALSARAGVFYRYSVIATDGGFPPMSGSVALLVIVTMSQTPPSFEEEAYTRVLSEGTESGTLVASTECTDQNEDDVITYAIASGNDGTFSIDNTTGIVSIAANRRLDYEVITSHTLVVECSDTDGLSDTTNVFVTVTSVNEYTPVFQFQHVSVQEHSIVGTLVTQLEWTDNDVGPDGEVTFNITSGNTNNVFLLTNGGQILVSGALDRESLGFYSLEIEIHDQAESLDERRSSTNRVNVTLSDINDHAPRFDQDLYTFGQLQGSEQPGHYIGTVSCQDADLGVNAEITYQLSSGNSELFGIDAINGTLSLSGNLDDRQFDNITFFVECVDAGSRRMTGSARVLVSVVESNRHTPVFTNDSYTVLVPEDTPIVSVHFLTVHASDEDSGVNGQVRYSLLDDYDSHFYIDVTTGAMSLLKPLDFESVTEYTLVVQATDGALDSVTQRSAVANVTVEVGGVNEYEPSCSDGVLTTVIDGSTNGAILVVDCTDGDAGRDGELSFIVTNVVHPSISVTSNGTIFISTSIPPNSTVEQYNIAIMVSDDGSPMRSTEVQAVLFYSFDNVNAPLFEQDSYFLDIFENEDVGRIIETFTATDPDPGLQGIVTYSLTGTDTFRIDATSGGLFIVGPLDYENRSLEEFTVTATDSDPSSPMSNSVHVSVRVHNVNDNSPRCSEQFYTTQISSNAAINDTVLTLDCSDADGSVLRFLLNTASSSFSIEESTGRVYVSGTLSPSTTTTLDVEVDDYGSMTTQVTVIVQIRHANSEPPMFTQDAYSFNVSEDTPLLSIVGTVQASDPDSQGTDLSYTIVNALPEFYVSSQGEIALTAPLDYEAEQQYSFSVEVTDGEFFPTAVVTVNVVNANDNFPVLSNNGIYGTTVAQGTTVGVTVLSFTCTDGDLLPADAPMVTDTSFDGTPFTLQSSGDEHEVHVMQTLTEAGTYYINITCSDSGGLSTYGQIVIFVPDTSTPEFSKPVYRWALSEIAQSGSQFTEVSATSSSGGSITYSIVDGQGTFYIHPTTGVVTLVGMLDYETRQTHVLTITATDSGNSQSNVLLIVQVEDENDQVPLTDPSAVLQVEQNAPVGFPLGVLQCSDGDTNPNATMYELAFTPLSGLFSVDRYGVVRLEGTLDSTPVYTLPVSCYDVSTPELSSVGLVTIQVLFTNTYSPEFHFSEYVFSIREDAAPLSSVGTVSAFDGDLGSYGELTYLIETQYTPEKFYVDSSTGVIGILSPLDRETVDLHNITVTAIDGGLLAPEEGRKTGTTFVTILVEDANDNPPVPAEDLYTETILTNHTILTPVMSVGCSDLDLAESGQIVYSIEPSVEDFAVRSDGAVLLTRQQSDEVVYNFYVVCADRGIPQLSSSTLVTITVELPQVSAPTFTMDTYTVVTPEDTSVPTTIIQVEAEAADMYGIVSGNDGNVFHISPTSGDISVIAPLDASQQQMYRLTVEAQGQSSLSSFATVVVMVTDVNDHLPRFSSSLYQSRVSEDTTPLTPLVQVSCMDADPTSIVSYQITGGLTDPVFSITQGGLVAVAGQLDYESTALYTLEVTCSDGGDAPLTAKTTVRIEVLPVNEFVPEFLEPVYRFTATENAFGSLLGRVEAEDGDEGSQGEVTYQLQDPGNVSAIFVEPSTGDILVANDLDYEERSFWNFTVVARDGAGAESFVFLEITVLNVNDVHPVVTPVTAITVVSHDSPAKLPIQQYSCTDGDGSPTTLEILQGNNQGYFDLNDFNQLVWTGAASTLTSDAIVSLTIECYDSAVQEQTVFAYIAVTVRVTDSVPPVFTQEIYRRVVDENTTVGSTVLSLSATAENEVQYDLFNLPSGFPFSIGASSGDITVNAPLNRELTLLYIFTVRATDVITGALGLALVEISIGDANDNRPEILPVEQTITLPEDLAWPTQLVSFACSDEDTGPNSELSFHISISDGSESVASTFQITSAGIVELIGTLDFESTTRYELNVSCSDSGNPPLSDSARLTVIVTGVNEFTPEFDSDSYQFTVQEGVVAGTLVGSVSASDGDSGPDGEVRFEIISGSGLGFFSVNSQGEIQTRTQSLNATEFPSLEVILRAVDIGQLSRDVVVTILLEDINELPQFSSSSYFASTTSDQPAGTTILEFVCYDTDVDNNSLLNVEIARNDRLLDVSLETGSGGRVLVGNLVINSPLDPGAYEIVLSCSDNGSPSLNSTASVTIRVEGVNLPPEFSHGSFAISVSEDTPQGTSLTRVNATDFESGTDVSYVISGGIGLGTFNIDPTTGIIVLVFPLDYETTPDYAITVTAYDDFVFNRQSVSIELFIYVINTNDIPPFLSPSGIQVITLSENTEPVENVKEYMCSDPDGGEITYSLGGSSHPFSITQSGEVQLVDNIDFEVEPMYSLSVTCSDIAIRPGEESLYVSSTLIIHVTPVNNYAPEFVSPSAFEVPEASQAGAVIATVQATDRDNRGQITYSTSSHTDLFHIDPFSGNITLIQQLDYETTQQYSLTIEASDNDDTLGTVQPRSTVQIITVRVTDTNDNRPLCVSHLLTATLQTGTYDYHHLAQLSCSDKDSGVNAQLSYSFVPSSLPSIPSGDFLLNSTTGELGFAGSVLTVDTVILEITVSDTGDSPLTTTVRVTVQIISITQPRFEPNVFNVTISENSPNGFVVLEGSVLQSALRNAVGDVLYALLPNAQYGNTFTINPISGDLTLSSATLIDFDEGFQEYSLVVMATVGSSTITAVVGVTLTDYNDNVPKFEEAVFEGYVFENEDNQTSVLKVEATDLDSGMNGEFRYSIDSTEFAIDPIMGDISTRSSFDREIRPSYSFQVYAMDLGSPQQVGSALVTVMIGDENDVPPSFTESIHSITIDNLSPPGTELVTFVVEDDDITGSFTFRIITDNPDVRDLFTVDSPGGVLRQKSVPIPQDHAPQYEFTVEVNDEISTDTTTVVIYVSSVTSDETVFVENVPDQTYQLLNFLLLQNFNLSSSATYAITEGDSSDEFLVNSNGELVTRSVLDRESRPEYTLVVQVVDTTTSERVTIFVTVMVADQNDNSPVFSMTDYTFSLPEAVYMGRTRIGQVSATDLDEPGSANSRIEYSLIPISGSLPDEFEIDQVTGEITVIGQIDRESMASFSFRVRARDFGGPDIQVGYAGIVIEVNDVNDNNPTFVPFDVVEFIVTVPDAETPVGTPLDRITAVLPGGFQTSLTEFQYTDPDSSAAVVASLGASESDGPLKYRLSNVSGDPANQVLVTTEPITLEDDNGTVLVITLHDEFPESNPISRNVTIVILNGTGDDGNETTGTPDTPNVPTEGVEPTDDVPNFFDTEVGIAVVVMVSLLIVTVLFFLCCLCCYCYQRSQRVKDPRKSRPLTVAQRIQMETERRRSRAFGRPWQYYGYSDIDRLEFPEFSPDDVEMDYLYGPGLDYAESSSYVGDYPYHTPSTGTSVLSSKPRTWERRSSEDDIEEEEEDMLESESDPSDDRYHSRMYSMGPILRAMVSEWDQGEDLLKSEGNHRH